MQKMDPALKCHRGNTNTVAVDREKENLLIWNNTMGLGFNVKFCRYIIICYIKFQKKSGVFPRRVKLS